MSYLSFTIFSGFHLVARVKKAFTQKSNSLDKLYDNGKVHSGKYR